MATEAQATYFEQIELVKRHIREHMDQPLSPVDLAEQIGFSVVHFHRLFTAYVGESVGDYVRRVRMERAAAQLQTGPDSVTEIALDAGYATHSAFSKAFRRYFGVSPSEYRELNPTAAAHLINQRLLYVRKEQTMQPEEIRSLPDRQVLYARATEVMQTPAFQSANVEAFNQLMSYLNRHQVMDQVQQYIAIYPDDPEVNKEVRFDAGVIFKDGFAPAADDDVAYQTLPGGRWAIFRHVGPYDTLWSTWQAIYRDWLPASGEEVRNIVPFEDYVDDPSKVAPENLRTDLYVPLK